jgi:16S rRNA (cytosine967-C5)-methyltransferase
VSRGRKRLQASRGETFVPPAARGAAGPDDVTPGGARRGRLGRIDDRVIDALSRIDGSSVADRVLASTFRNARDLGSHERHEVSDTVYGVLRARRRLEDRLDRALKKLKKKPELYEDTLRVRWLVLTWLAEQGVELEALEARDPYAFRRIPGLFARVVADKGPPPDKKRTVAHRIGVTHSIPDWLAQRLIAALGEVEAERVAAALEQRAPLSLRANVAKTDRDALAARLAEAHGVDVRPTPWSPWGLLVDARSGVEGWDEHGLGQFEVQDEGSQLLALAVGAQPGQQIIDACAGAGGKTLALAAAMQGRGRIVSTDTDARKLEALQRRARRAALTNVETECVDFVTFPDRLLRWADAVLIDAPCTGTGTLRRAPDLRWRLADNEVERYHTRQAALLERAIEAVKPGGFLIYATCSVLREENEAVVQRVLDANPRLDPAPLAAVWGEALAAHFGATHQARIGPGPDADGTDGFYVARLRRSR